MHAMLVAVVSRGCDMKKLVWAIILAVFVISGNAGLADAATKRGKIVGGLSHEIPIWFKDSFLDIKEDAKEAAQANKHLILFMTLNGCPYCTKMLDEIFEGDKDFIQAHFDSIAINIRGARMVTPVDRDEMTEKTFAGKKRVIFTPTILFLDADAKTVFRINGLWNAKMFRSALEYIKSRSYKKMSLASFARQQARQNKSGSKVYKFRDHDLLVKIDDFSKINKPVALLFEDRDCTACNSLHDKLLNRAEVRQQLEKFVFTRLDAYSDRPIIDFAGDKTTPRAWAAKMALTLRPGLVLFGGGKERLRIGSELYGFHFKVALNYVNGGHYKNYKNWIEYLGDEQEKILKTGKDIDIGDRPAVRN
jgi:thioredoxin-related protein